MKRHFLNWKHLFPLFIAAALSGVIVVSIFPVSAQAQPIGLSENRVGVVSAASPLAEFTLSVPATQTAQVQVLSVTSGFAPFFSVTDVTNGIPLVTVGTDGEAATVQDNVTLAAGVTYVIQVQSANGVFGEFLISVQPGPTAQPATPLTTGQPVSDQVSEGSPSKQYRISGDPVQIQIVNVHSEGQTVGPRVTLRDGDSGQTLAVSGSRVIGTRFRLGGVQNYIIEVSHDGSDGAVAYTLCAEIENGTVACPQGSHPPLPAPTETLVPAQTTFQTITIPANGPCSLTPATAATINVRSGPSTSDAVVAQLALNTIAPVSRKTQDSSWYEIRVREITGWVAASVVRIGGNCDALAIAGAPAPVTETAMPPVEPNATATPSPMIDATATPTEFVVIGTLIAPPTPTQFLVIATLFDPTPFPPHPTDPPLPTSGTIQP